MLPFILSVVFTFGAGYLFNFSWGSLLMGNSWFPLDFLYRFGGSNDYIMYLADIAFWFVAVRGAASAYGKWGGRPHLNQNSPKPLKKKTKKPQ
jgi:hypothetical protein